MQQRILAMLLTALLLLGVFPVASAAESSEYADVALMTQTIYDDNQEVFTVGGYLFVRGEPAKKVRKYDITTHRNYIRCTPEKVCGKDNIIERTCA